MLVPFPEYLFVYQASEFKEVIDRSSNPSSTKVPMSRPWSHILNEINQSCSINNQFVQGNDDGRDERVCQDESHQRQHLRLRQR
ncbi:hypothetical protein M9Y10_003873 [Tritrichomonas musculus]|uniref:Uncharacterized protein n=1 Tax=Tritrichomonas musculus TaxID=1915356 RepID=A0ABR2JR99_9EUKA